MSTKPIDFSSVGGVPINPTTSKKLDFSSVGGIPADASQEQQQTPTAMDVINSRAGGQGYVSPKEPLPDTGVFAAIRRAASNIGGFPYDVAKAMTQEPQTPEEVAVRSGAGSTAGQLMLGLKRILYDPMQAEYHKAQQLEKEGKPYAGHAIASAIPVIGPMAADIGERVGSGDVGALAELPFYALADKAGEAAHGTPAPTTEGAPAVSPRRFRVAVQNSLGAGPRMTEKLVGAEGERFTREQGRIQGENKARAEADLEKQREAYEANQQEFQKAKSTQIEQAQANADKAAEVQKFNQQQEAAAAQRGQLETAADQKSVQLGKGIEDLEKKVGAEADRRFEEVKSQVGNPEAPPTDLIATVKDVKANILQNIPENVKEFNRILGMEGEGEGPLPIGGDRVVSPGEPGYDAVKQAYVEQGLLKETEPLTWDKLQSLKSRIDARLRGPRARLLNGDLKRALYATRDGIVDEMGKMAEGAGAGELWSGARDFYRQYKEDFYTPTGPSGSGSPVAQALDAVDPSNIRQPFIRTQSTLGNRGIDILRKYADFGGNDVAKLAEDAVSNRKAFSASPKPKLPKEVPQAETLPPKGTLKPIPEPRPPLEPATTEGVDITKARYDKIRDKLADWKGLSKWEARTLGILAIPERILSYTLDRPSFVKWASQPTGADLAIIDKAPAEVRTATMQLIKGLADSRNASLSPELAKRVMQYGGATSGGTSVKDIRDKVNAATK